MRKKIGRHDGRDSSYGVEIFDLGLLDYSAKKNGTDMYFCL